MLKSDNDRPNQSHQESSETKDGNQPVHAPKPFDRLEAMWTEIGAALERHGANSAVVLLDLDDGNGPRMFIRGGKWEAAELLAAGSSDFRDMIAKSFKGLSPF